MEYIAGIFFLGLAVTLVVIVGLARAAEFARSESAERLEIDPLPENWTDPAAATDRP
jgi:hypothetical protein